MKAIRVQVVDETTGTVELQWDVLRVEIPVLPVSLPAVAMTILVGHHAVAHVEQAKPTGAWIEATPKVPFMGPFIKGKTVAESEAAWNEAVR